MAKVFQIEDLYFRYPKGVGDVVKGISFSVEEGSIFGLLGPSGAGKSTTQRLLTKLLSGFRGSIRYFGKDLNEYNKSFYEKVGIGFEMPVHFNKLTARENLDYFGNLYQNHIDYETLLTRVGLREAANRPVGEYSKGMKVRLNFIRALLNDPQVLFLDEPTAGLDPNNAKVVKDIIREYREKGRTIFITTHLMGDVEQLCDQVVFINNGLITETSTVRDLKLKYGRKEIKIEYWSQNDLKSKVYSLEGLGENEDFLSSLKQNQIETIHSGETTLEDIFIKLTGVEGHE
ncbi:MAG: ABC transporter ATP-binding protein [Candidatus Izemoplasmatales bacterium]|jgi:fluoroquinolone transport system ATP-binding protein|nr:ABC transporter ATP-binding protein [Candidatus Izemoplasmatales bacterium]NLF49212.1 ABC transporter ATP-binding protein [Acholeplasmataceae bacterium]MDD4355294.1 ABC transporter ATP-binding protein [Candidatus Izemoplasmatales bacterium]MDD4987951.1 ABC transporter ATP-binding protein [Candidatus Izemoplasmatales bacterium]MDD5601469.1 ABC transporter ATP-binding protein [Candidatus Izemoplasmatales bacterium]